MDEPEASLGARLDRLHEDMRRFEAGLRAASPREAAPAMDAAPHLPSRVEVSAAFAAASPETLVEIAGDLAAHADLGAAARMAVVMCERTRAAHEEAEARAARLRVLPPGGERLPAAG